MTILDEVRLWAREQCDWQREAVARLEEHLSLSADDDEDLYAILKAARGIPDPEGRAPRPQVDGPINRPMRSTDAVSLLAVTETRNVNALARNGALTFAPTGLTVVYGSNGSGKSGYARVLKQACFARDKRERVLPNTDLPREEAGVPSADLVATIGDQEASFTWTADAVELTELSRVAVFDHTCARAFVDNEGSFSYSPAGLDILADLGATCVRMKAKLQRDIDASAPNVEPLRALMNREATVAGKLAKALPAGVSEAQIIGAAGLSKEQSDRLDAVTRALAAPDPKVQAAAFRNQALRVKVIADAISSVSAVVNQEKAQQLRVLVDASNRAKDAADHVTRVFNETPGQLPETGSELWRAMYEAARNFAVTSEPTKSFPSLEKGMPCPLCQQELEAEATSRLSTFEAFIKGDVQQKADEAREAAAVAFRQLRDARIDIGLTAAVVADLTSLSEGLVDRCSEFQRQLRERQGAIVAACGKDGRWETVPDLEDGPVQELKQLMADLSGRATAMDAAADEAQKLALTAERDELEARRLLGDLKDVAIEAIQRHANRAKLQACAPDVHTLAITRKSTELTNNLATAELMDALNGELDILNIADLQVVMKAEGERGRSTYKLILERPGRFPAGDVLSEGEQRAVAIASFLTERRLSGDPSGVIFDDPVCSLDHRRRQRVARRIAKEAEERQVIVFTHDMFFLFALMQEAEELGVAVSPRTVSRAKEGFGVCVDELPFDGASTKSRVGWLRNKQVECARLHRDGEEVAYNDQVGRLYSKLREAWEGCVEEVLLNGTVERFRKSVETNRLAKVYITDDDVSKVVANMGRCSNYAHNVARRGDIEMPTPEDLTADIEILEGWRAELESRKKVKRAG
jgi:energy-coupling factor transporter ATP-binding protein EcfA2